MELVQWFFLGILFTLSVLWLAYLSTVVRLDWYAWAGLIVGALAVMFGIAWAGASFLEGIPRSGALGLLFFSGGGLVLMLLVWRYLVVPELEHARR